MTSTPKAAEAAKSTRLAPWERPVVEVDSAQEWIESASTRAEYYRRVNEVIRFEDEQAGLVEPPPSPLTEQEVTAAKAKLEAWAQVGAEQPDEATYHEALAHSQGWREQSE